MIPVTKPFLPPKIEFLELIDIIWHRNWLTNNGPILKELEDQLKEYLKLKNLSFLSNGTVALQIAIKALQLKGEIITTPFSYVATTSSIVWEGCKPIFVDINKNSYNLNPDQIEGAITNKTSAILATHVFGNPCDVNEISRIAKQYNLKVIYDAAHCFGVNYKGKSILGYGDISTISFHATKLFHTVEGGAVIASDSALQDKMSILRNFGHDGPDNFAGIGINGKNSELHAAVGLCNLKYIDEIKARRKQQYELYINNLQSQNFKFQQIMNETDYNYSYFPIVFESEVLLNRTQYALSKVGIHPRRYFYPSLTKLPYVEMKYNLPISDQLSKTILCLPLYHTLDNKDILYICKIIKSL